MSKKGKPIIISWIISTIIFVVLTIVNQCLANVLKNNNVLNTITLVYMILWFIYNVLLFVLFFRERKIQKEIGESPLQVQLDFWKKVKEEENYIFIGSKWVARLNLGLVYLMNNDISLAKQELVDEKILKMSDAAYYPLFLIALYEGDMEMARKLYDSILAIKKKMFNIQKNMAIEMMNVAQGGNFDETLLSGSRYPIVKAIVLKSGKEIL